VVTIVLKDGSEPVEIREFEEEDTTEEVDQYLLSAIVERGLHPSIYYRGQRVGARRSNEEEVQN
jgi:hypothetical protein